MAFIKVTPDVLRGRAKEVDGYNDEFRGTMSKLQNLVAALGDEWQGEAQTAFTNDFEHMKKTISSFSDALNRYARAMDKAADQLEATDQQLKSQMSGSTVG